MGTASELIMRTFLCVVRMKGLEPPRLSSLDPKSSAATNYATSAWNSAAKVAIFLLHAYFLYLFFIFNFAICF